MTVVLVLAILLKLFMPAWSPYWVQDRFLAGRSHACIPGIETGTRLVLPQDPYQASRGTKLGIALGHTSHVGSLLLVLIPFLTLAEGLYIRPV